MYIMTWSLEPQRLRASYHHKIIGIAVFEQGIIFLLQHAFSGKFWVATLNLAFSRAV